MGDHVGAVTDRRRSGDNRDQLGALLEHPLSHLGLGPDAEQVDTLEGGDELALVEGTLAGLDVEAGLLGGYGIVGGQVPLATGAAGAAAAPG